MNGTIYRKPTENEIQILLANNCQCNNWNTLEVVEGFDPKLIRNCTFRDTVRIGKNVRIDGIRETIANYILEDNVSIKNSESLVTTRASTFGNGVRAAVLIESGGREVPIYDGLTAQIAYITAMYRHRPEVARVIDRLVDQYAESVSSDLGRIGKGTVIADCGPITDIRTGEYAVIQGASELTNGTVNSTRQSPTLIGRDVIARNFIVADSAEVTDVAFIEKCFVGQGCKIGKGFTAIDTLFFANCDCQQGEACSVFAGPFTVTHHKSTLMIACMVSFFNAGSGSNQSNHMYRLGPMHQGVLERGCKTGSSSYVLFPARIGAFSVLTGRHYCHTDTSALPFSRLLDEGKETVIVPGAMLKSIGTERDARKWQKRDRRKGDKNDRIHFDLLNPYIMSNILEGIHQLKALDRSGETKYNRVAISPRGIDTGRSIYQLAVKRFVGEALAQKLSDNEDLSRLIPGKAYTAWSDLSGQIAPTEEVFGLLAELPRMTGIDQLRNAFGKLADRYDEWCWDYTASILEDIYQKPIAEFTRGDYAEILAIWVDALREHERLLSEDVAKEYDVRMRVGYGIDTGGDARDAEFTAIHGTPETNPFLENLRREIREKTETAHSLIRKLQS